MSPAADDPLLLNPPYVSVAPPPLAYPHIVLESYDQKLWMVTIQ